MKYTYNLNLSIHLFNIYYFWPLEYNLFLQSLFVSLSDFTRGTES